jgi:hypothetical protein
MRRIKRCSALFFIAFLSIGLLVLAENSYVAAQDKSLHDQQNALVEGAKQMQAGNKLVVDKMEKKGIKDPAMTAAGKKMTDGYDMVVKGQSMMTGSTMEQGKEMVTRGANMMMDADKETRALVKKHGMEKECASDLESCSLGEKKVKAGFQTYGLHGNWESGY